MQILCNDCPRKCGAVRSEYENIGGFCQMPLYPKIARADLHFWEEPCISGPKGSGTIFFSGCSLKCVYCQNYEISHKNNGKVITPKELAEIFAQLENKGAHNINFVNPTHYIWAIKEALKIYKPNIPLVYNSSGYDLLSTINENIFDIYLFDLKYISATASQKYSLAKNYFEVASKAISCAYDLVGEARFDKEGIMQKGIIVRHLVLPLATNEAIKICDWVVKNLPNAYLSIMSQYTPCGNLEKFPEINRKITNREYEKVVNHLVEIGAENVFVQDRESSSKDFIPDFNMH